MNRKNLRKKMKTQEGFFNEAPPAALTQNYFGRPSTEGN